MSFAIPRARALAAGLIATLALAGPAAAFPQPKYPTTLRPTAPPPSTPSPTPSPAPTPARAPPPAEARPSTAKPAAASGSWSVYVVQRGDTLTGVGRRFGESIRTLADLNELDPKVPLKAGSRVKLPPGAADSGKDPHASGPSPFTLDQTPHAVAEKPRPLRMAQAAVEPAPKPAAAAPARERPAERLPSREVEAQPQPPLQTQPQPQPKTAPPAPEAQKPAETVQAEPAPSDAVASGRGRFIWPIQGRILLAFGPLAQGQRNDGVNIAADRGAEVKAAADGVVVYAGSEVKGYGNTVLIMHAGGWDTVYTHLDKIEVGNRGFPVKQGQVIGTVGSTGDVDQPQLHFETRFSPDAHHKYNPVDPLAVLPQ
jgi:murein DD-endopeptidase MepM/ murein hydrolase activator NlpD